MNPEPNLSLLHAEVLVEIGELFDAEVAVAGAIDRDPDDLRALSLLAKIQHMRGQLSEAIACWAHIFGAAGRHEPVRVHLANLLHLAQDPERWAGEMLVSGAVQRLRRPVAHVALGEAFRLYLAQRPAEAIAQCDAVAARYRAIDPAVFKLAVLAAAWLAELSGDLPGAAHRLEALGELRGLETDPDRLVPLAALYERIGTPDRLEAAGHIYRYLERSFDESSTLARLSAIHRRLGELDRAEEYEARYLQAFRRTMHRPTASDILRVAATHYIPLGELIRIWPPEPAPPPSTEPRAAALAAAAVGDVTKARDILAGAEGDALLDQKYLADLHLLAGDVDAARAAYGAALRRSPRDLRVLGQLLGLAPSASATIAPLDDPQVLGQAVAALEERLQHTPTHPSAWEQLATLLELDGQRERAEHCRERARVLRAYGLPAAGAVGRALAASVYHVVGRPLGLIHEVWADREPAPPGRGGALPAVRVHGNLAPDLVQSVHNTFLSVRAYARAKFPYLTRDIFSFNYSYKVTKEDERSSGLSAGLPTALAFLSVFLQRPLPQDVVCSGALVADAHDVLRVRAVGDTDHKVAGAYNRNARMIVLPHDNRDELRHNPIVPAAIERELVRYARDLDGAVRLVFGDDLPLPPA